MTDPTLPPWSLPGYSDITGASVDDTGRVIVTFANGDQIAVPAVTFGGRGTAVSAAIEPDGLSVRLRGLAEETVVSWEQIRASTDPEFAQELRGRDVEEAKRVGLRLRALREDRGLSQRDVAKRVGMSAPQLSKIESGSFDLRLSTVQSLLRAMGARFEDIGGVDAPEVSQRALRTSAARAGLPPELFDRLAFRTSRNALGAALKRAFKWSPSDLVNGIAGVDIPVRVAFKSSRPDGALVSPLLALGFTVSEIIVDSRFAANRPNVPANVAEIRDQLGLAEGTPRLSDLLTWAWRAGVTVVPLVGRGGFAAAAWWYEGSPVVVLKESRELEAFWLFDLAHELGHIALGHTRNGAVIDVDSPTARHESNDSDERDANQFALDLLLPDHDQLIRAVQLESRGEYLRFKGAVETVASMFAVNPGLLGMTAAYELDDIGEPKDRWGSATNLAKIESAGRPAAVAAVRQELNVERLNEVDRLLIDTFVLASTQE